MQDDFPQCAPFSVKAPWLVALAKSSVRGGAVYFRAVLAVFVSLAFLGFANACKIDNSTSPTPPPAPSMAPDDVVASSTSSASSPPSPALTVTAPQVLSPTSGSSLLETRPTLVVTNASASDGSTPQYTFEVAGDAGFSQVVTRSRGVPEGPTGQTAWQIPEPLEEQRYYWRARAWVGNIASAYSPPADFIIGSTVVEEPGPAPPDGVLISDPLRGSSVGEVGGGVFLAQGWQVVRKSDYIRYEVPPVVSGFVEWDTSGLYPHNPAPEQHMLLGMWDPSRGPYRANPFRVHVQKLDTSHNPPYVRLRWIANGEEHNAGDNFLSWDPFRVYRWRLEWGPGPGGNVVRLFVDGVLLVSETYVQAYAPDVHWVELGVAERAESIVGVVYSNVRIGRR